ncbi:unnamed protein product, partial [Didymodactylos carnosus]
IFSQQIKLFQSADMTKLKQQDTKPELTFQSEDADDT